MTGGPPMPAYTGVTALRHAAVLGETAASPADRCPAGSTSVSRECGMSAAPTRRCSAPVRRPRRACPPPDRVRRRDTFVKISSRFCLI